MALDDFFSHDFWERYSKYQRGREYEPLSAQEVEELRKEIARMNPEDPIIQWRGYDVLLADSAVNIHSVRTTTKMGNEKIAFFWKGEWMSAFMPFDLAEKIEPDSVYLLVGRFEKGTYEKEGEVRTSYTMSLKDAIRLGSISELKKTKEVVIKSKKEEEKPVEKPKEIKPAEKPIEGSKLGQLKAQMLDIIETLGIEALTLQTCNEMGIGEGIPDKVKEKIIQKVRSEYEGRT